MVDCWGKKSGCKQYLWYMIFHKKFYVCVCVHVCKNKDVLKVVNS